jgi:hypothetical protein
VIHRLINIASIDPNTNTLWKSRTSFPFPTCFADCAQSQLSFNVNNVTIESFCPRRPSLV